MRARCEIQDVRPRGLSWMLAIFGLATVRAEVILETPSMIIASLDGASMKRSFVRLVVLGSLVISGFYLAACHSGVRRGRSLDRGQDSKSLAAKTVASPLIVSGTRGDLLKGINSIEIATPILPGNSARVLSHDEVRAMITRTAREVMTLKIIDSGDRRDQGTSNADGVLRTEIVQFQDRQGSAIGGEPATVSFRMSVVSSSRKETVWDAQYYYRQEPLSDNLLKLGDRLGSSGSGAGWVSGHGLLQRGISAAIEDFNRRREQQFLLAAR